MWRLPLVALLAASARSQVTLIFTSDISGHYVPYNESGADCPIGAPKETMLLETFELSDDDNVQEVPTDRTTGTCLGGLPRQSTRIKEYRHENDSLSIVVSAGNVLGSGAWELLHSYDVAVEAAKMYDVMGLGPGEFLRGGRYLEDFLAKLKTAVKIPILACNLPIAHAYGSSVQSSAIVHPKNSSGALAEAEKVGFVGFVDPEVIKNYASLDPVFRPGENFSECVNEQVKTLKNETLRIIVVGCVSSLERLNSTGLLQIEGVNAFVLSGLPDEDKRNPSSEGGKVILATEGHGQYVGWWNIGSDQSENQTKLDSSVKDDSGTHKVIKEWQEKVDEFYKTDVMPLHNLTADRCPGRECSMGDVICDAVLISAIVTSRREHAEMPRPIAVWPGQNITGDLQKGVNITLEQLYNSLPDTQVALATASGAVVTSLFARAASQLTKDYQESELFLQVSGVRVTYDLDLAEPYRPKYLMTLCLTCSPLEYLAVSPEWNYTIILPASMLEDDAWADVTSQFDTHELAGFSARDAVATLARHTRYLLAPAGGRIDFTHIPPDPDISGDTFITVLVTTVVCMVVFVLALVAFRVWSRK